MRAAFSEALVRLAKADPNVLLLTGDHGYALFDDFRKECPEQYINAGIAEQNMVGMAAILAVIRNQSEAKATPSCRAENVLDATNRQAHLDEPTTPQPLHRHQK